MDDFKEFDRQFRHARTAIIIAWSASAVIAIGVTGFIVWVIIMLLRFFGVV